MKKVVLICALVAAFCAEAAQLKRVENLRAGDLGTFGSGKITSVEGVSASHPSTPTPNAKWPVSPYLSPKPSS